MGSDLTNRWTDEAWAFLKPFVDDCRAWVFTRHAFVPEWLPEDRVAVIPPSIDPFAPKNEDLSPEVVQRILVDIGVVAGVSDGGGRRGEFTRRDGSIGRVVRRASILPEGAPLDPDASLVVQVSRWDRLKDMAGVMAGFASHVVGRVDAYLALVGPMVAEVSDDPEGADVLAECVAAWEGLSPEARGRIRLVSLPMDDIDENAAMVNALQRHASMIVQKSLGEGFGLTVAEGMWKAKTVVASAVGGIVDQIAPGTGVLLDDPRDLDAFGKTVASLLEHPADLESTGMRARRHVIDGFLGDRHLIQYAALIRQLRGPDGRA